MRAQTLNRLIDFDQMSGSIRTIEGYKYNVGLFYQHTGIKDHKEFLALSNEAVEEKIYDWIDLLKYKTQCTQRNNAWKNDSIYSSSIL